MIDDVQDIKNVVLSYVEFLDVGDLDGIASVFEKATVRVDGSDLEFCGSDAFKDFILNGVLFYGGIPCTKHVVTNLIVKVHAPKGTATARSYYTAFQARPELPLQPILAGRFHDRLERDVSGWHIVERVIYADLIGDVRFHLRGPEGAG